MRRRAAAIRSYRRAGGPGTWPRRAALRALALAAAAPVLAACPRAMRPLRIAAHVWPGHEPLFLAAREGWLSPGAAELVETRSATESLLALSNEVVDGAALSLDEVLRVRDGGAGLAVIAVLDVSSGADAVLARPGVRTLAEIAGKRIGVESSAVAAVMLHHVLRSAALPSGAVLVVPLTADAHVHAWRSGWVDAVITYEPIATELEADGAVRLFDSRQIPGAIVDVLAVTPAALAARGRSLRALVAGHFAGRRHLLQNRQDAAHRMARHLRLTAPQVLEAYRWIGLPDERLNRKLLDGPAPQLLDTAREVSGVMVSAGLLRSPARLDALLRPEFLPEEPR